MLQRPRPRLRAVSGDLGVSAQSAKPLTVANVLEAFAVEGVALRRPRWRDRASRRPVPLVPSDPSQFLFSVTVYGRDAAERPLGLHMANAGFETVRVQNVVISYAPDSAVVHHVRRPWSASARWADSR
jgi:hypothetical protein